MTPAEAQEIDRLEFEADCAAARQRAYALVQLTPPPAPKPQPGAAIEVKKPRLGRSKLHTVGALSLTMAEWAARTGMTLTGLHARMRKGWTLEQAVTTPRSQKRPSETVH